MPEGMQKDWRELCVAVTNESDSTKLTSLVQELIEAQHRFELNPRPGEFSSAQSALRRVRVAAFQTTNGECPTPFRPSHTVAFAARIGFDLSAPNQPT